MAPFLFGGLIALRKRTLFNSNQKLSVMYSGLWDCGDLHSL